MIKLPFMHRFKNRVRFLVSLPKKSLIFLLWQKSFGRETVVHGNCNMCGDCCRNINLHYEGGWIKNLQQFEELKSANPDYERFNPHSKDNMGYLQFSCSWLTGMGTCRDHTKRMRLCKAYPSKNLLFYGGKPFDNCGFYFSHSKPFRNHLNRALKKENEKKKNTHS